MKRRIVFLSITIAVLAAVVLVGCATKRTAAVGAGADETRVRQTLAQVERQINQSDLGFVNVFAKDAVIIAPSAPDIAGIDAIRALYAGVATAVAACVPPLPVSPWRDCAGACSLPVPP